MALSQVAYSRPRTFWQDVRVLLHLPRAAIVYAYLVLGAALAPVVAWDRLLWSFVALFFGLQLGAYALDELKGRHASTQFSDRQLKIRAVIGLGGFVAVGVYLAALHSWWILALLAFGAFTILVYNLEVSRGTFHNAFWYGAGWGFGPVVGSYFLHALVFPPPSVLLLGAFAAVLGVAHLWKYGNTKCYHSHTCLDYARDRGETLCHGQVCASRLVMPIRASRLQWRLIDLEFAFVFLLTAAIAAWRFGF
ncbi:MAG: hypothetical protein ACE5LS_05945 [Thermoplasmata archaeon]